MARPKAKFDIVAEDKTAKAFKSVGGRMDAMGRAAKATGALVAAAVTGLGLLVSQSLRAADAQAKLAQSTGFTVQELGRLSHAAELSGTSFDRVAKSGLNRFSRSIFDANAGLKESAEVFDAMDINIKNLDGTLKTSGDLLNQVADKFATYEDGVAKSALAQKLFGRAGTEMIPLLNAGSVGMARMGDEAERLGIVFDDKTAKASERFNDNLTRLKAAYTGQVNSITQHLLPTLESLSNRTVANAKDNLTLARTGEAVASGFKIIVSAVDVVVGVFGILGRAAGAVVAIVVDSFTTAIGIVKDLAQGLMLAAKGDFAGAFEVMGKAAKKPVALIKRDMVVLESAFDEIKDVAVDTIGGIVDTWTDAGEAIEAATPELADKIAAPLVEAEDKIANASKKLPEVVKQVAVDPMVETAKNGIERLGDVFAQGWRDVLDGNANFGDTMKSWFKGLMAELLHTATTNRIVIGIGGSLGLGGAGTANASTDGLSSLFGGGDGGGGFSTSGATNLLSDPVGGMMNAASYAQQFALDRGMTGTANFFQSSASNLANTSNLGNGVAGFAGNFGANALLGDDRGAGANIGGAIGGVIGSFIPIPYIGTMIGAFLGNAVGGLFGGGATPPKFHVRGSADPFSASTDNQGNARSVESFGAFGGIQFSAQHIADDDSFLENQGFVDALAQVDNLVASSLSDGLLSGARAAAQNFELHTEESVSGEDIFAYRSQAIAASLGTGYNQGDTTYNPTDDIDGLITGALLADFDVNRAGEDLAKLDAAIQRFGKSVVQQAIDIAGFDNNNLDPFFDDVALIGMLSPAIEGTTASANLLAQGIAVIDDNFAQLAERAGQLGLPLDRLNELREAEKRQLEQTLGLGGVRDLLNNLTATSNSPLAFTDKLGNASELFRSTASAAEAGDQLALNQLPGTANNLIALLTQGFASGESFFNGIGGQANAGPVSQVFADGSFVRSDLQGGVAGFNEVLDTLNGLLGIPRLAMGGVTNGLAFIGDGPMTEAGVPMPDGRTIPVTLSSDMITPMVSAMQVSDDRAAANAGGQAEILEDILAELQTLNAQEQQINEPKAVRNA